MTSVNLVDSVRLVTVSYHFVFAVMLFPLNIYTVMKYLNMCVFLPCVFAPFDSFIGFGQTAQFQALYLTYQEQI